MFTHYLSFILFFFYLRLTECYHELCSNSSIKDRSCSLQLLGDNERNEDCRVQYFPTNSTKCKEMEFGPITENKQMGDIKLEPYIWEYRDYTYSENYTVINITFSNIKWKTMKFRFQRYGSGNVLKNHCRNIEISSNVTVRDQSVLYYDCVWYLQDSNFVGQNYVLDFAAEGDKGVKRGQYHFIVPSSEMLSPTVSIEKWKPFIYIELQETTLKLHVAPAPLSLGIKEYLVKVLRSSEKKQNNDEEVVQQAFVNGSKGEATYEYSLLSKSGQYSFEVTPLHINCNKDKIKVCPSVKSPVIIINNEAPVTVICIASVTSLIVAILFAYYITLRLIRRYWCREYWRASDQEKPDPPIIMIIYSPTNTIHADCVDSFVSYLRNVCYLDVMYDRDISNTEDPVLWCEKSFKSANYIVNIVSPTEEIPNIYERGAITALRNIDKVQLNILKSNRGFTKKHVVNVIFEHVNGQIPLETQNDRTYYLLRDWQKLISYLSKNVAPKQVLSRTDKGTRFLDDLNRAKKLLGSREDKISIQERKVLL